MATCLAETASRPEFIAMVQELRETPPSRQPAVLQRVASIDYMESQGVSFPAGSRLSPRSFEDPKDARVDNQRASDNPSDNPVASFANGLAAIEYQGFLITTVNKESQKATLTHTAPSQAGWPAGSIRATIQQSLEEIAAFVARPEFQRLLEDLYALPESERPQFVLDVVMNAEARAHRGIVVPDTMVMQRSTFADARPTLFCVSKLIPLAYPWRKVTVTFDNTSG
jgi:hypothetical protein